MPSSFIVCHSLKLAPVNINCGVPLVCALSFISVTLTLEFSGITIFNTVVTELSSWPLPSGEDPNRTRTIAVPVSSVAVP